MRFTMEPPEWKENMPASVYEDFRSLVGEIFEIHTHWDQVKSIRGNAEHLQVANKIAPGFFFYATQAMAEVVVLGLARLFDKAQMHNDSNLTFLHLIKSIQESGREIDKVLETMIEIELANCTTDKTELVKYRHKWIAHNDRAAKVRLANNSLSPLDKVETETIERTLAVCLLIINLVENHYWYKEAKTLLPGTKDFLTPPQLKGDADFLMYRLEDFLSESD